MRAKQHSTKSLIFQCKIRWHEFVSSDVLLKRGEELATLCVSSLLDINEMGQTETKPKSIADKI